MTPYRRPQLSFVLLLAACPAGKGTTTAGELACVMGAAGLASNLAALRALAGEGIQEGHMRLHARKQQFEAEAERARGQGGT